MISSVFTAPLVKWGAVPDGPELETPSSWLLPVRLSSVPAMLKVFKPNSDEQDGSDYLKYVDGQGAVRVLAADDASLLMERAVGTRSLVAMVLSGADIEAAEILAGAIAELHAHRSQPFPQSLVPLDKRFESLFKRAGEHPLLNLSASVATSLLITQRDVLPLHGDLHHANVLDGGARGWLAIDPKGLIGERTYEMANIFGNPWPHGEIVHDARRMNGLAELYAARLTLDVRRVLAYALAHAGLSASWDIDGGTDPGYRLRCIEILAPLVTV
jgi:streptomycin 6-kinase